MRAQLYHFVLWTLSSDAALTPLRPWARIALLSVVVFLVVCLVWFEVRCALKLELARRELVQVSKSEQYASTAASEQEVHRFNCERCYNEPDVLCAQICTFICARLDSSALSPLINVLVFCLKQLVHTVMYHRQLLIISAVPRISFNIKGRNHSVAAQ
jgi:hypothetical protein